MVFGLIIIITISSPGIILEVPRASSMVKGSKNKL